MTYSLVASRVALWILEYFAGSLVERKDCPDTPGCRKVFNIDGASGKGSERMYSISFQMMSQYLPEVIV